MLRRCTQIALPLLVLLITGCGAPAAAEPGAAKVRVAFIPPAFTSPFHVAVREGAEKTSAQIGWTLDVVAAERESDFARQVSLMQEEIQKGVAAIAVNPIDAKAIVAGVKKANNANIPVFMANLITPVDQGQVVEYIGYDQWSGGAQLGKYACTVLGGKGNVFILTGIPGFHASRRTGGFKAALGQYCPGVKIVGEQTAEWEREKGANVATAALQQHPEINLFYGNSDEMDIGACIAAKKLGRTINRDIYCIGIDGNAVTLDLIDKGELTATLGVYPEKIGETLIEQIARHLKGEQIPAILQTPSIVVDAGNLADYQAGKTWKKPIEGRPEIDNGRPTGQ